ncbi:nucleoside diphosphate kinase regulator [Sphingobium sufflavum]|uniref:nucleoside diphosphate kinase regulator n=1 Tax=Sphingobium sufflavum TaxID=1129547 RepID=UPI002DD44D27|nr:nucleoside diphosphate kinase regulator [Sphingobium sufflavum]
MTSITATRRPRIRMIDSEADALGDLAVTIADRLPDVSAMLLTEIGRAHIAPAKNVADSVVTMHATVDFTDQASGATRTVQLVWPAEADIEAGRISILTPVGAGLIGLSVGQSILWPDRSGHERTLTIERVRGERAGGELTAVDSAEEGAGDDRETDQDGRGRNRPAR